MLLKKVTKDFYFGDFLNLKDFQCRCKNEFCTQIIIDDGLPKIYNKFYSLMLERFNIDIYMTSGNRCRPHNLAEEGSELSQHIIGNSVDISRHNFEGISLDEIINLAKIAGFTYYKVYRNHIHFDRR